MVNIKNKNYCFKCVHYNPNFLSEFSLGEGTCHRYPKTDSVLGDYYCGEFIEMTMEEKRKVEDYFKEEKFYEKMEKELNKPIERKDVE